MPNLNLANLQQLWQLLMMTYNNKAPTNDLCNLQIQRKNQINLQTHLP